MWALDRIESVIMKETAGLIPTGEAENAVRDLGVQNQLVTDYTSMVVLADDVFEKRGIARNNKQRITVERNAQSARASQPPPNRRADNSKPMFGGRSHGVRGGGAFDPWMALLAVLAALALWRLR